jgi:hypothetical protein
MPGAATVNFTEGFDEQKLKRELPSWLISLVLHALLFVFLTLGFFRPGLPDGALNGSGLGAGGNVLEAQFGQGGGTELNNKSMGEAGGATELPTDQNAPAILIPETRPETESVAATQRLLDLPTTSGIGATRQLPLDVPKPGVSRPTLRTAATGAVRGNGRGGRGRGVDGSGGGSGGTGDGAGTPGIGRIDGTSFFQVAAQGNHFCYVVDCSSSMDGGAMGLAKAELMASIQRLDSEKKFQILFYNSEIYPMTNGRQEDMFYATESNRLFARKFINNQQPDNSTLHRPALTAALRFAPDVIFFLTDGDIPELDAKDLQDLKRINGNNTQINVIQFGQGPKLGPTNWLERLAKDHRGTYRYRDIDSSAKG